MSNVVFRLSIRRIKMYNCLIGIDMKIKRNLGAIDRFIRTGMSIIMIYVGFFNSALLNDPLAGIVLGLFGCMSLLVAIIGNCPFYSMIGLDTSRCSIE